MTIGLTVPEAEYCADSGSLDLSSRRGKYTHTVRAQFIRNNHNPNLATLKTEEEASIHNGTRLAHSSAANVTHRAAMHSSLCRAEGHGSHWFFAMVG
jgi:hypothetical protein